MNSEKSYDSLPNFTAADCEFHFLPFLLHNFHFFLIPILCFEPFTFSSPHSCVLKGLSEYIMMLLTQKPE